MFKLTFFLLEGTEVPEVNYGDKKEHKYQNTDGVLSSVRRLPVDISNDKIVCSSLEKQDPTKQLREAGHPFNYIGSELIKLHGQFELVSSGVNVLTNKIDETKTSLLEKVDSIFQKKFLWSVTLFGGMISFLYGALGFLQQKTTLTTGMIHFVAACFGIMLPLAGWLFFSKEKKR
jgi:hypothetical protein